MTSILEKIRALKQQEVKQAKQERPLSSLLDMERSPTRDFIGAIKAHHPAIIAEIKRASPSRGVIREDFDVASIAQIYETHGACALSVLTDKPFFQGDHAYLALAKAHTHLPVLRKDFIIDAYQIDESRALGADCILLIVALLDDIQLHDLCQQALALQMAVLVESHTLNELMRAITLPTPLIGINNRNLHTFVTDLQCTIDLKKHIPEDKLIITESGIHHHQDLQFMQSHGINAFLVGEHLMKAADIGQQLDQLIHGAS